MMLYQRLRSVGLLMAIASMAFLRLICHIFPLYKHTFIVQPRTRYVKNKRPYNTTAGFYDDDEIPFIATVREDIMPRPNDLEPTPNLYDILAKDDCLPTSFQCRKCLRNKNGSTCERCRDECLCYCRNLCHISVQDKFVAKRWTVTPPLFQRDPSRLIPRIIHQTWFENVTQEKYPNMSRLVESFKQSGFDYRFYTDDSAGDFLSTHFPPEAREAFDILLPGAFKADLFRYCLLLIYGGVYADIDVLLESNLNAVVAPDIGFMVPLDEVRGTNC